MKHYIIYISFLCVFLNVSHAQSLKGTELNAIKKQIEAKARTFCKYVVAVGTSPGQKGCAPEEVKLDIIRNKVHGLFYKYYEDPRYMKTSYANSTKFRKRKMSDYFVKLMSQSRNSINSSRQYELRYAGVVPEFEGKEEVFKKIEVLSDGCVLYRAKIKIEQLYHIILWTNEGPVAKEEHEVKEMDVNVLEKPSGKFVVLLGDVNRVYKK